MNDPIPTEDDCPTYGVSIGISGDLGEDADWFSPYITDLHFQITQEWWSDERQDVVGRVAGAGQGFILHVENAINIGVDIVSACDDHSSEAHEYCSTVIGENNEWREDVQNQFRRELYEYDVLAFTKMEIGAEHRGKRLGLLAMLRMMQMFGGGCGLILIKPWPLQYTSKEFEEIRSRGKTSQGWTERRRNEEFRRLTRYWCRLGFERIGKSDFYALPHFAPLPSMGKILKGKPRKRSAKSHK